MHCILHRLIGKLLLVLLEFHPRQISNKLQQQKLTDNILFASSNEVNVVCKIKSKTRTKVENVIWLQLFPKKFKCLDIKHKYRNVICLFKLKARAS